MKAGFGQDQDAILSAGKALEDMTFEEQLADSNSILNILGARGSDFRPGEEVVDTWVRHSSGVFD
ncbi:MAG: hypothetical protein ABI895_29205 [Deltaproteobacteria bacterium]